MRCVLCDEPATSICNKCNVYKFCSKQCASKMKEIHAEECMEYNPTTHMAFVKQVIPADDPLHLEQVNSHQPDALTWMRKALAIEGVADALKLMKPSVARHYKILIQDRGVDFYLDEVLPELDADEDGEFLASINTAVNSMTKLSIFQANRSKYQALLQAVREKQAESDQAT